MIEVLDVFLLLLWMTWIQEMEWEVGKGVVSYKVGMCNIKMIEVVKSQLLKWKGGGADPLFFSFVFKKFFPLLQEIVNFSQKISLKLTLKHNGVI